MPFWQCLNRYCLLRGWWLVRVVRRALLAWLAFVLSMSTARLKQQPRKEKSKVCSWNQGNKNQQSIVSLLVWALSAKLVTEFMRTMLGGLERSLKQFADMCFLHGREGGVGGATFGCDTFAQYRRGLAGAFG